VRFHKYFPFSSILGGPTEELKKMLDVNVLGLSVCTKQAFQSMKERGVEEGHIIHINRLNSLKSLSFARRVTIFFYF
jgi:short-subunit dehydrogenase